MATLHLIRHGQASFGAADYDRLSPKGGSRAESSAAGWPATPGLTRLSAANSAATAKPSTP